MVSTRWHYDSMFYQIYPQSLSSSNGNGKGDIEGVINELDYLQPPGVDAIWPNSLWFSWSFGDPEYDIIDHKQASPRYGP